MRIHITKTKKSVIRILCGCVLAGMLLFSCLSFFGSTVKADMVTDYIGVMVGYVGMDFGDYVQAGDYHISELEANLPIYEAEFSYFSPDPDPAKYNCVVDAARGFSVIGLLDYAHIYYGDIMNLSFYVMDHNTIWSSFDRDELFASDRYYFHDLASHRKIQYGTYTDEDGKEVEDYDQILGYDFEEAWKDCTPVQPMLAIEDSWSSYNEVFESSPPDFSNLNTGTRFHLLYGQHTPTENDMQRSAKYVRWVYVTLYGKPEIGKIDIKKEGRSRGSHTVETTVSGVNNEDIAAAVSELLNIRSSNEEVAQIREVKVEPDPDYSDLLRVMIYYDVVGEGEFTFKQSFGTSGNLEPFSDPVNTADPENPEQEEDPEKQTDPEKETNPEKETEPETKPDPKKENGGGSKSDGGNTENGSAGKEGADKAGRSAAIDRNDAKKAELSKNAKTAAHFYQLSADMAGMLSGIKAPEEASSAPEEKVTQVKIADNTAEDAEQRRRFLLYTGAGCAGLCLLGGAFELVGFRIRMKRRKKIL